MLNAAESALRWRSIRDALPLAEDRDRIVWRLSVPPSDAPAVLERIGDAADLRYFLDWAGGLIWLSLPGSPDAGAELVRSALRTGHATLVRAPRATRAKVDVFQPQCESLSALTGRIKQAFDPDRRLNPGRMRKTA
jgi:glycolate oxidase FAD binding subunit